MNTSDKRRRDTTLTIRVTQKEKERIQKNAAKANRNVTDYLVALSLETPIHVAEDIKPLLIELKRIGNNINQLAIKANALGFVDSQMLKNEALRWHKFQAAIEREFLRPEKSGLKWQ